MSNSLEHLKDVEYHGVRELANAAERVLRSGGTSQEKGTVAEFPNERTVRYYITEGLLDQAIKKSGVTSIFGYEHLLTLLTIKKLQSDGLPISVIKTLIEDKTVGELEKLHGEDVLLFSKRSDLDSFRQSTGHTDDSEILEVSLSAIAFPPTPRKNKAKEYLESLLMERSREKEPQSVAKAQSSLSTGSTDWRRYEIVPGVELHVARSYRPLQDAGFRQRILVLIDGILHSRERRQK